MNRRTHLKSIAALSGTASVFPSLDSEAADDKKFSINYVLSSAMYGPFKLAEILPEVKKSGSIGLDIWGKPHGTQREEVDEIGVDAFADLLKKHDTNLTVSTRYPLGCFGLQPEMPILKKLGGKILVCGSSRPKNVEGAAAKKATIEFLEKMKPHADAAGEHGLTIAVENHANQFLYHPDAIRYFAELNCHEALGIAFAPHHLHEHISLIPKLIKELGNENIPFIYFQEYGIGSKKTVEKKIELEQMPGKGTLDYVPIVKALREIAFTGVAELFMHPTPRGLPVLETAKEITDLINESRHYIDRCVEKVSGK